MVPQGHHGAAEGEDSRDEAERGGLPDALLALQHLRDDRQGQDHDPGGNPDDHLVRNVLVSLLKRLFSLHH